MKSFATNICVLHRTKQTSEKEEGRVLLFYLVMELTTTLCPSEETKKLQKGGK
jgi:hypothetical protein